MKWTLVLVVVLAGCGSTAHSPSPDSTGSAAPAASVDRPTEGQRDAPAARASAQTIDPTQFDSTDLVVGGGATAELGSRVSVRYRGMFLDGTVFDETASRPFEFTLGQGEVIRGWDRGVVHMRVGGKRRLVVPPDMAYGARGSPPRIPPNATLVFEIELVELQ